MAQYLLGATSLALSLASRERSLFMKREKPKADENDARPSSPGTTATGNAEHEFPQNAPR